MAADGNALDLCACHKTRMAARAVTRAYDEALRPVRMRATQFAVLLAVGGDEAVSIAAVAKSLGMDRSTLARNLRPLEREGLIGIGAEGWRRSRTLTITKKGRTRLEAAMPLWEKAQAGLRRALGDREWTATQAVLDRLIASA